MPSQLSWASGAELIGGNRVGLFVTRVPIFDSILAVLMLRESFEWYQFVDLTLVLPGMGLSERLSDKVRFN